MSYQLAGNKKFVLPIEVRTGKLGNKVHARDPGLALGAPSFLVLVSFQYLPRHAKSVIQEIKSTTIHAWIIAKLTFEDIVK